MIVTLFWLLIAVSDGSYNHGTPTVIAKFGSLVDCQDARRAAMGDKALSQDTNWSCLPVTRPIQ